MSRRLRAIADRGEPFSEARVAELHERFFGTGRQVRLLDETCQRIEVTMSRLLAQVGGVSREAGSYGAKLETYGDRLDRTQPEAQLRDLVGEILAETRAMQARARRLEGELDDWSQQIEALRSALAKAQRDADTDGLTGLPNRKYFDYAFGIAADEARVRGAPLCLLLADIDHFKRFNDAHGHQVGDQVLRLVAEVLTASVKGRDLAARYGGEEFAVLLPQTDLEGARHLAEHIRHTVAGNRIRLKADGRHLGAITLSLGCAEYRPQEALSDLIRRADEALYQAKREGRDQVAVAPRAAVSAA